jgi:hypothetical protein
MLKIVSIGKLIRAIDRLQIGEDVIEDHVKRIQDRLDNGIDSSGKPFADRKGPDSTNNKQPLVGGARLFDNASISSENALSGPSLTATVRGKAAIIVAAQNERYKFMGFNDEDRRYIRDGVIDGLREGIENS